MENTPQDDSTASSSVTEEMAAAPPPPVPTAKPAKVKKPVSNLTFYCVVAVIVLGAGLYLLNQYGPAAKPNPSVAVASPAVTAVRSALAQLQPYVSQNLADAVRNYNQTKSPSAPEIPAPSDPADSKTMNALAQAMAQSILSNDAFKQLVANNGTPRQLQDLAGRQASRLLGKDVPPKPGLPVDAPEATPQNVVSTQGTTPIPTPAPAMPTPSPVAPAATPTTAPAVSTMLPTAAGQTLHAGSNVLLALPAGATFTVMNKQGTNVKQTGLIASSGAQVVLGVYTADPATVTTAMAVQQLINLVTANRKAKGEDVKISGPKAFTPDGKLDGQKFLVSSPIVATPGTSNVSVYYVVQDQANSFVFLSTKLVYPTDKQTLEVMKAIAAGLKSATAPAPQDSSSDLQTN